MLATTYFIFAALHILAALISGIEVSKGERGAAFAAVVLAISGGLLIAAGLAL